MDTAQTTQSETVEAGSDSERQIGITEWGKIRDTLQFFDDKLHDLRKYGFSFITVFLTMDGILLSSDLSKGATATVKFAVFGVTLILILALHFFDKNYTVFQEAAASRALVLERKLNIELTEIIAQRYRVEHINKRVLGVYGLFTLCVLLLGCFSLGMEYLYLTFILVLIAVICTIYTITLNLTYRYKDYEEDWTISPLECSMKGMVKITLTNCSKKTLNNKLAVERFGNKYRKGTKILKPISFAKSELLWEVINEETGEIAVSKIADRDIDIYDSHTWLLTGKEFGKAGVYQLRPRLWPLPLYRRIIVFEITSTTGNVKGTNQGY